MSRALQQGDPLTLNQEAILDYIESFKLERGYSPSVADIKGFLGVESTFGVRKQLDSMQTKGYIKRDPMIARSIVVIDRANA
jgi:repressor LexA